MLLDEIGDISRRCQARLLRVLQERVYEPLGGVEPVKADVRLLAATNKKPAAVGREGQFPGGPVLSDPRDPDRAAQPEQPARGHPAAWWITSLRG